MRQPIKFYVDEHVATAVVKGLRQRGADVLTVLEAGVGWRQKERLRQVERSRLRLRFRLEGTSWRPEERLRARKFEVGS